MTIDTAPLARLVDFASGGTPARSVPEFFAGDIPWVTGADIGDRDLITPRSYISTDAVQNSAVKLVPKGTILLVTRTSVGKVAVADRDVGFSQDVTALTPKPGLVDGRYLRAFLQAYAPRLAAQARGATIQGVAREVVAAIEVPLPSLPEQRRIASVLDEARELHYQNARSIAVLGELGRAHFHRTFVSDGFELLPLVNLLRDEPGAIRTGPFGSQLLHSEFVEEGVAVLGIDNVVTNEFVSPSSRYITEQKYSQLARYTVRPGDVLVTIMGTVGRCVVVPDDIGRAINTKHLCCITIDQSRCLPEYLRAYFLMHPVSKRFLSRSSKGAIMDGLNMGILKALPVVLPPLSLQREYVLASQRLRELVELQRIHLAKLDELFASLQHRAFRGEL